MNKDLLISIVSTDKFLVFCETRDTIILKSFNRLTSIVKYFNEFDFRVLINKCIYEINSKGDIISIIDRVIRIIKEK